MVRALLLVPALSSRPYQTPRCRTVRDRIRRALTAGLAFPAVFALLALVSAPSARATRSIIIVAWIAQTFLQLGLLPIIIVGLNVQSAGHKHLEAQDAELTRLVAPVCAPNAA
jgi:hypothetical protein